MMMKFKITGGQKHIDKRSEKLCVKMGAATEDRKTRMWRMMQNTIQRTKSVITLVLGRQAVILVAAVILRRKILVAMAIILLEAVEIDATRRMAAMHG